MTTMKAGRVAALGSALLLVLVLAFAVPPTLAQSTPANVPETNSSYIDAKGTAHVTRVVPVPTTVSPEAQAYIARRISDTFTAEPIAITRTHAESSQNAAAVALRAVYPVNVSAKTIAGVPTREIMPLTVAADKRDRVLINVHGGGFTGDWGSLSETIPIASLTGTKVVAVLYRLSPENKFPAAVEDTVAVYRELLKTYKPQNIGLYGTSAGAILTAEVTAKLKQQGLPLPAVLGIFSGGGDFSKKADTFSIYGLLGLSGPLWPEAGDTYTGATDLRDPILSPVHSDLKGFPPTLFISSTRDFLLSSTALLDRAFLRAGVESQFVVFEALNHAFWNDSSLPESKEAYELMADFFNKHLGTLSK